MDSSWPCRQVEWVQLQARVCVARPARASKPIRKLSQRPSLPVALLPRLERLTPAANCLVATSPVTHSHEDACTFEVTGARQTAPRSDPSLHGDDHDDDTQPRESLRFSNQPRETNVLPAPPIPKLHRSALRPGKAPRFPGKKMAATSRGV